MTKSLRYPAHVQWSDEDEGYIAVAPDLPGCSAFGETQVEALAELQHAIAAWRTAAAKAGNPLPAPTSQTAEFSGRLLLRLPKSLHGQLARQAEAEGVSLNHYINVLLAGGYAKQTTSIPRRTAIATTGRPPKPSSPSGRTRTAANR